MRGWVKGNIYDLGSLRRNVDNAATFATRDHPLGDCLRDADHSLYIHINSSETSTFSKRQFTNVKRS